MRANRNPSRSARHPYHKLFLQLRDCRDSIVILSRAHPCREKMAVTYSCEHWRRSVVHLVFLFFYWESRLYTRHTNTPPSNDTMVTVHFPQSSIHLDSAPAIHHDLHVWFTTALPQRVPAKVCAREYSHMVAEQEVRNDRRGERAVTEMAVAETAVTSERMEIEMNKMEYDVVQIKQEWWTRLSGRMSSPLREVAM